MAEVRVYVPGTLVTLAQLRDVRRLAALVPARAVTTAARQQHPEDPDLVEDSVLAEAATDSLHLLASDRSAPRRRVVVVAEVPDGWLAAGAGSAVHVLEPVPLSRVRALMVDETGAGPAVAAAIAALDGGCAVPAAVEDLPLLWYATQELASLLA